MLNTRSSTRILLARALTLTLTSALASALVAASAQAIPEPFPYFNGPPDNSGRATGFDNSSLQLPADEVISTDIVWQQYPVESGNTTNTLGLLLDDTMDREDNVGQDDLDRLVTLTLINNDTSLLKGFVFILTFLNSVPDYSSAAFELQEVDPMVIAFWGNSASPFFFAGFRLELDDFNEFTDVDGVPKPSTTRSFRYTADVPQTFDGGPRLLAAYAPDFELVPEPATGLLLTGALLVAVGTGRKRIR